LFPLTRPTLFFVLTLNFFWSFHIYNWFNSFYSKKSKWKKFCLPTLLIFLENKQLSFYLIESMFCQVWRGNLKNRTLYWYPVTYKCLFGNNSCQLKHALVISWFPWSTACILICVFALHNFFAIHFVLEINPKLFNVPCVWNYNLVLILMATMGIKSHSFFHLIVRLHSCFEFRRTFISFISNLLHIFLPCHTSIWQIV